jgi:hypothetical protein
MREKTVEVLERPIVSRAADSGLDPGPDVRHVYLSDWYKVGNT